MNRTEFFVIGIFIIAVAIVFGALIYNSNVKDARKFLTEIQHQEIIQQALDITGGDTNCYDGNN